MPGFHLGSDEESQAGESFSRAVFEGIFHEGLKNKTGDKNFPSGCGGGNPRL